MFTRGRLTHDSRRDINNHPTSDRRLNTNGSWVALTNLAFAVMRSMYSLKTLFTNGNVPVKNLSLQDIVSHILYCFIDWDSLCQLCIDIWEWSILSVKKINHRLVN